MYMVCFVQYATYTRVPSVVEFWAICFWTLWSCLKNLVPSLKETIHFENNTKWIVYYWFEEKYSLFNTLKIPAFNDPMSSRVCLDEAALSVNQVNQNYFEWVVQAFLVFRGFGIRNFRFNAVHNSILFSSPLVLLSNLDLRGFCFPRNFYVFSH